MFLFRRIRFADVRRALLSGEMRSALFIGAWAAGPSFGCLFAEGLVQPPLPLPGCRCYRGVVAAPSPSEPSVCASSAIGRTSTEP